MGFAFPQERVSAARHDSAIGRAEPDNCPPVPAALRISGLRRRSAPQAFWSETPSGFCRLGCRVWEHGPHDRRLLRLLISHCLVGMAAGVAVTAALLIFDVGGLRTVLTATREAVLAVFVLGFAMAALLGSMAMGVAVMTLPKDFGEQ